MAGRFSLEFFRAESSGICVGVPELPYPHKHQVYSNLPPHYSSICRHAPSRTPSLQTLKPHNPPTPVNPAEPSDNSAETRQGADG